jgi:hypothetical protein
VRLRAVTEEFARDSFENLLFSICRFFEIVGSWPRLVTVVGWDFKRDRFELHRQAIRWNSSTTYFYDGVNNPVDLAGAIGGELVARAAFGVDPYGTGAAVYTPPPPSKPVDLGAKRIERNAFRRTHPYEASCPDVAGLLKYKGPQLYAGPLPW